MLNKQYRLSRIAAHFFSGSIALALLTFVCFQLGLNLATTSCLYLTTIVLLSLQGSFLLSAAFSLIGAACLAYYFAPPICDFRVSDPFNAVAIVTFCTTSTVINYLISRVRRSAAVALVDLEDRKRAEEALQKSESYLTYTQQLTHAGSWAYKQPDICEYWSAEMFRIFGLDSSQGCPSSHQFLSLVHPEDRQRVEEAFIQHFRSGGIFDLKYRIIRPDGRLRIIHDFGAPALERGVVTRSIGACVDITEQEHLAEELRISEQQWRNVFENNPTMYFMIDTEGTVVAVNPLGAEQLGYTVNELVGRPVFDIFFGPDREAVQRHVASCLKQFGQSMSWELRKVRKDGSVLWVRETGRAVLRGTDPVVLIACEDITERKNAEDKIREQEIELRQILNLVPQHITVLRPDRTRLYINQAALDFYGIAFEEWQSSDTWRFFHPDDRERVMGEAETKFMADSPFELEGRLLRSDGKYRWFLLRLNPLRDEQGRITRWYAAGTDIEDRKEAEQRLQNENIALREEIDKASMFEEIIGTSAVLHAVLSRISKVAPTDSSVLVTGETGTGKELVARAIHRRSQRSSRAFVSVNCAAIPRELIASELFGHEKGSFTGATQRRLGRFELAEGGTIFLDEIGELPTETQIALLRVLQEHEFQRVGGTRPMRTDVRVIAATNRDLEAAITDGTFRSDLFYRLNVFPIEIPPLRERKEDIPLLVEYFIDRFARKGGKNITGVNKQSLDLLQAYPWPGNIRELQNVIERSVIVCETENFSVDESWLSAQPPATEPKRQLDPLKKSPAEEKAAIEAALSESGGRVYGPAGAAAKLAMPRSTLESKIKSLKIDKNRFKAASQSKSE
jgi:PAS domain S-box-containing protein